MVFQRKLEFCYGFPFDQTILELDILAIKKTIWKKLKSERTPALGTDGYHTDWHALSMVHAESYHRADILDRQQTRDLRESTCRNPEREIA